MSAATPSPPPLKIGLVSSEVAPFAKTGGLADVSAALARYLVRQKHDVRLVMPMYRSVREGSWTFKPVPELQDVNFELGGRRFHVSFSTAKLPESRALVWFVRCPELYDREGIYTQDDDEHVRFAVLNRAALALCQWSGWSPDVLHVNDWHASLIPLYLRTLVAWDELFETTRTVLTIHNIGYQGVFDAARVGDLGLEGERRFLHQEDLEAGRVSFLKTGLIYADALTTVSETYAREIQGEGLGMGLHELLAARSDHLVGIVNGVDYGEWNPARDAKIPFRFSARDLGGKARNKAALCERFGLDPAPDVPLFGIVSRLTFQKGFELLPDLLPVLLHRHDLRLVVLGSGEEKYENYFDWLARAFGARVGFHRGYDDALAHLIEAGSDLFVMPSRYEPCGLNQMYSLKYGTAPVVRRTGGLADTVERFDPATGRGTGFVFDDFSSEALMAELERALEVWRDREAWARLMANAMAADFSWERQGVHYVELYRRLLPSHSTP